MKKVFQASQFTPTKWDSAEQKAKFANHYIRFMKSGCSRTLFLKWFYHTLSNSFGNIAHYNLDGFYQEWFETPENKRRFLEQCLAHPCYGDPAYTYSDVEKALQPEIQKMLYPLLRNG